MTFVGKKNTWERKFRPNLVLLHWTGGENSADTTYRVLINRNLGVTFCIDREGVIYQFLDPLKYDPRDTGGLIGQRSVSIEIANYGFVLKRQKAPKRGRDRTVDDEIIHGAKVTCARFYPVQIESVVALTRVLCDKLSIPFDFPRERNGSLALRELTRLEKASFKGVMGHFHKTDKKYDPGFHIFRELESQVTS